MYLKRTRLELDTYLTVIDVIQMLVRIKWIINDQRSAQAITILSLIMAVIPICTLSSKIGCGDLVKIRGWNTVWSSALNR